MFVRTQTNGSRTYLLFVDSVRVDGKVKQRVLLRLGRLDELLANGQLDSLIQSLGRFSEKLAVLGAHARGDSVTARSARIGPALIFQRLWQECSIDKVLQTLLQDRRFEFSVERAIFLTVLHRLFAPWRETVSLRRFKNRNLFKMHNFRKYGVEDEFDLGETGRVEALPRSGPRMRMPRMAIDKSFASSSFHSSPFEQAMLAGFRRKPEPTDATEG